MSAECSKADGRADNRYHQRRRCHHDDGTEHWHGHDGGHAATCSEAGCRGASGDPTKVMLTGRGWDSQHQGDDLLYVAHCEGVTIAELTFADCRSYGIKVEAEAIVAPLAGSFVSWAKDPVAYEKARADLAKLILGVSKPR